MAYIYQITNDVNGKIYVGKTEFSIEKRFKEHCQDSRKQTEKHRPLYAAMRKYGVEHFHIELLEETNNPEEREIYWIEKKGSFKNGYNATIGGDGRRYIDHDLVVKTYLKLKNASETARFLGINDTSVGDIIRARGIKSLWDRKQQAKQNQEKYGKPCAMIDKNTREILKFFTSMREAARFIIDNNLSPSSEDGVSAHISQACNGKRKTAYGCLWEFI